MYSRHSVARLLSVAVVASSIAVNLSADMTREQVVGLGTSSTAEYAINHVMKPVLDNQLKNMGADIIVDNKYFNSKDLTAITTHVVLQLASRNVFDRKQIVRDVALVYIRDKIVQVAVYGLGKVGYEAGDKTKATLKVLTTVCYIAFIDGLLNGQRQPKLEVQCVVNPYARNPYQKSLNQRQKSTSTLIIRTVAYKTCKA